MLELLRLKVNEPRNALPLFKHIELEWDRGNIAIIPSAGTAEDNVLVLQLCVHESIQSENVCYADDRGTVNLRQPVRGVTFGFLHQKTVTFDPESRPFVRALLLRWATSWNKHPDFPVPEPGVLTLCNRSEQHKNAIGKITIERVTDQILLGTD